MFPNTRVHQWSLLWLRLLTRPCSLEVLSSKHSAIEGSISQSHSWGLHASKQHRHLQSNRTSVKSAALNCTLHCITSYPGAATSIATLKYTTVIPNYCESSFLTKATLTVGVTDKIMIVEAHQDHTESINASFFLSALSPPDCRNVQTPAWCFSVYLVNRAFAKLWRTVRVAHWGSELCGHEVKNSPCAPSFQMPTLTTQQHS